MLFDPPAAPIIVRVVEEPLRGFGLGDVLISAVGITGVMALGSLLFGLLLAATLIGFQKVRNRRSSVEEDSQTQSLGLTPPASR